MNTDYVIAIGGSGVRAAHALLHLCAAGLCDKNLRVLLVDTDSEENGNTSELLDLRDTYKVLQPSAEALFKAGVKNPLFLRKVEIRSGCSLANGYSKPEKIFRNNKEIGRALMTDDELKTDVTTGLYGKPCTGALTFHRHMNKMSPEAADYIDKMLMDAVDGPVNLMLIGSAFGGTGATGLLLLRHYLQESINKQNPDDRNKAQNHIHCAVTILAPYFTVTNDTENKFCAQSHYGRCAMALRHYEKAEKEHKKMFRPVDAKYLIGVPVDKKRPVRGVFAPAGKDQKNWPHACDYIAAFACVDYFMAASNQYFYETKGWRYFQVENPRLPLFNHIQPFVEFERVAAVFLDGFYKEIPVKKLLTEPAWLLPELKRKEQKELLNALVSFLKDFRIWIKRCGIMYDSIQTIDQPSEFLPPLLAFANAQKDIKKHWKMAIEKKSYANWNELLETIHNNVIATASEKKEGFLFLPDKDIANYINRNYETANWYECGIPSLFDQAWRCKYWMQSNNIRDAAMAGSYHDLVKLLSLKQSQHYQSMHANITIQRHYFWHQKAGLREILAVDAPECYHFGDTSYCHASFWVIMFAYDKKIEPVGFLCPDTSVVPSKRFMKLRDDSEFKRKYLSENPGVPDATDEFRKALDGLKANHIQASSILGKGEDWDPQAPVGSATPFELQYIEEIFEIPSICFENELLYYEEEDSETMRVIAA